MSIFPTKILLATDGSEEASLAARTAADLAGRTGSELHVVTVAGGRAHHMEAREVIEQLRHGVERVLEEQMSRIEEAGGAVDGTYVRVVKERRDRAIVGLAEELGVGLIVLGSRGRGGAKRALLGSVSDSVVRLARCPVMVVRERDGEPPSLPPREVLLLATDGSEEAGLALRTTVELADATGSELHLVTVGREYRTVDGSPGEPEGFANAAAARTLEREAQGRLDDGVKQVEEAGGTVARAHRRMGGRPDEKIVRLAEELDAGLVVVGSRGLGGVRRALMGSVSDAVVRNAPCPVLVVRGEAGERRREEEIGEKPSFWQRLFGPYPSPRQERVLDYVIHRISDGANLREVTQEEYVRRNASPDEVEQLLENPRLVEAARRALGEDFSAGKLDPK